MKIIKKIKTLLMLINIKLHEQTYKNRLKYLFKPQKGSDALIIVFSAFTGEKRRYNYIKTLKDIKCNKLFILDNFGVKGSYYLYENGEDYPKNLVISLIKNIINKIQPKRIITTGSSKGGTAAIYFGLEIGATEIYSGACQFNLGSYLHRKDHEDIFQGMMGGGAGDAQAQALNSIIPEQIHKHKGKKPTVYVVYSKKELTYERQIIDLLKSLTDANIPIIEKEYDFEDHDEIGVYFGKYMKKQFIKYSK